MNGWETTEGSLGPLGCVWLSDQQAYNFAIYSKDASRVTLLLYGPEDLANPALTYKFDPLRNKTGPVWHSRIPQSQTSGALYYAYSIDGPNSHDDVPYRHAFNPQKVLLDPYARSVFFPRTYDRTAAIGAGSNVGKALLGGLPEDVPPFEWGEDCRPRHGHDLIIYELHVRGFTMNANSQVSSDRRGTFAGVIDKIPYLQDLGITAVELMPVFEFDHSEPNYWGYMPLNFFAPHHRYASENDKHAPKHEFQKMVKTLHQAGIEVILDVVYNHTGEGDARGPCVSFKGIDNATYYMISCDPGRPYADYTGVGNTLNCAHPAVRQMIVDSLRYWVSEMHVDGFRFDLASVFSRSSDGSINFENPPIFGDIAADPNLAGVRLIAEPWEGNGEYPNYQLGVASLQDHSSEHCCMKSSCACPPTPQVLQRGFPGIGWHQWNDKFRNTIGRFVKSDSGLVPDLMTRIYGSSDVFPDSLSEAYRPYQSLNYIVSHDGPTLYDLVAYTSGESWNCGERDGEEDVGPEVMRLRKRQVKNFFCLLLLSNGIPMFRAGDEFLQTQFGDRNPYNIDDTKTWLDWGRLQANRDVFRFVQQMVAFRRRHHWIARSTFWRDDIHWYGVGANPDLSYDSHSLAYCLDSGRGGHEAIYVMINAYWEPLEFTLQEGKLQEWRRIVDTYCESPDDSIDLGNAPALTVPRYTVQPRSIAVLQRSQKPIRSGQSMNASRVATRKQPKERKR